MTKKIIWGIDPDSREHGLATYINGELKSLENYTLMHFMCLLDKMPEGKIEITAHIEDVCANKAVWHAQGMSQGAKNMAAQRVGMCKQAQLELERLFEYYDVKVVKHKISSKWKKGKLELADFKKVTGWTGRSNEDNRSAAWFGHLGVKWDSNR